MKAFHKNILKKERWVDIHKFVSKSKRELSNGLFEIFGNYSDEPPDIVRDNLLGWIYDNFRNIENWFSITLKQKGLSLSDWAESMHDPKQPGDELCLYLLCRMYQKHTLVHLKHHWWSTIQHTLPGNLDDILNQCHMELVFVREWVFSKVKVIHKPISACAPSLKPLGIMDASMSVDKEMESPGASTNRSKASQDKPVSASVIPENVIAKKQLLMKNCIVHIERLHCSTAMLPITIPENNNSYDMHARPPKPPLSQQTSECPHAVIDYSKFMSGNEDDGSPPRKRRTVNLLRTPSSSRIAAQHFHTKPLTTPRPVRNLSRLTTTTPVSSEETKIAIDALLSLGSDLPTEEDITDENATLMPVGNIVQPPEVNKPNEDGDKIINLHGIPECSTPPHLHLHLHLHLIPFHKANQPHPCLKVRMTAQNLPTVRQ